MKLTYDDKIVPILKEQESASKMAPEVNERKDEGTFTIGAARHSTIKKKKGGCC